MTQAQLILFGTSGCHLCELAEALIEKECRMREGALALCLTEIADQAVLMSRYGVRVPVLRRSDTGAELDWPFDAHALQVFLGPEGPSPFLNSKTTHEPSL